MESVSLLLELNVKLCPCAFSSNLLNVICEPSCVWELEFQSKIVLPYYLPQRDMEDYHVSYIIDNASLKSIPKIFRTLTWRLSGFRNFIVFEEKFMSKPNSRLSCLTFWVRLHNIDFVFWVCYSFNTNESVLVGLQAGSHFPPFILFSMLLIV